VSDIEQEHEDLLAFLYACPVGLVDFDRAGEIGTINPHAMKHLLPLCGTRDVGNIFAILEGCAPELRNAVDAFPRATGSICDGHRITVDLGNGPGGAEPKTLACTIVKISPDRFIATFTDVSVQVSQERRLRQAETWFASLLGGVNDYAVLSILPDGTIDAVNDCFFRQTGYDGETVLGRSLDTILIADKAMGTLRLADQLRIAERDGWYLDESWQTRRNGERYWCQRLFAARRDTDGRTLLGYVVVLRDVVPQSSDTQSLRRMLTVDELTGAANRGHFGRTLERELRRHQDDGAPLSLLLMDIDHFKAVNDAHGHPVGDVLLRGISGFCRTMLRPSDLFARIGGEEFAALLPDTSLAEALEMAERLRGGIETTVVETPAGSIGVTVSLGCVTATPGTGTIDALIKQADDQLYAAKRSGRNRISAAAEPLSTGMRQTA
jgi:diguanylate cyclase (GGDEF)-like protein/PAS domain S-box-containing protein